MEQNKGIEQNKRPKCPECPNCRAAIISHIRSPGLDKCIDVFTQQLSEEMQQTRKEVLEGRKGEHSTGLVKLVE